MSQTSKIAFLLVVLVIVFIGIGWILAYNVQTTPVDKEEKFPHISNSGYVEVEGGEVAVPSKRIIVSDRFVGKLDKDATIVTISSDGNAYNVRNGAVLVDETVIKADSDSYSVRRLNKERFSVSSN